MYPPLRYDPQPSCVGHLQVVGNLVRRVLPNAHPGFAHQHLVKLLPSTVDRVSVFIYYLNRFTRGSEDFLFKVLLRTSHSMVLAK